MNYRQILLNAAIALPLALGTIHVCAQQLIEEPATSAAEPKLQQAREQLQRIQKSLVEKRLQLEQLRTQLARLTDQVERDELQKRISQEEAEMSILRRSFENIALGGVDSSVFDPARRNLQFNWQEELKLIMEPLFQKMKELTDRPRQIEQFKTDITLLDSKLRVVNRALTNLEQLRNNSLEAQTRKLLDVIHQAWTQQLNDIQREKDITQLRLNVMLDDEDTILRRIHQSLNDFITGSGRNLALSIAAFFFTLLLMKGLFFLYNRLSHRNTILISTRKRIFIYAYQMLTLLASTLVALLVLYFLGDMMLMVLALIVLALILLGLRTKLPLYIEEARLLLDVGSVREHERVIYRNLPWMVRSLGVFSHFYNPELEGLLRLPISEMSGLVSRPHREDEPWFPTRTGDWIMFVDGSIGQVLRQTPDTVQIRTGGSIRSTNTATFMQENLRNLSQGFCVSITFGVDYQHQAISTTEIPGVLRQSVEQAFQRHALGKHVENIMVEFKDAGPSSLNYLIAVGMKGEAAESYYTLGRLLQQTCVNCCNANGWVIPFNQITLNAGSGFDSSGIPISPKPQ